MNIHFICLGNTFRSRLADAYLRSLAIPRVEISSSGVIAREVNMDVICWYTREILTRENLLSFGKESWTQTSPGVVSGQDLLVFMHSSVYAIYERNWGVPTAPFEVWDVEDGEAGWDSMERCGASDEEKSVVLKGTSARYKLIVRLVDDLVKRLHL